MSRKLSRIICKTCIGKNTLNILFGANRLDGAGRSVGALRECAPVLSPHVAPARDAAGLAGFTEKYTVMFGEPLINVERFGLV